jgi:serine protease Do
MSIKKIFSISIIMSSMLCASVSFKDAPNNFQRVMPNSNPNIVLSYNDAIKDAQKSVVFISTEVEKKIDNKAMLNDPFFRFFFGDELGRVNPKRGSVGRALGSGVIVSHDGYIITNAHVVKDATKIKVSIKDSDKEYDAKIIGSDKKTDIAVIKIDAKDLPVMSFADSSSVKVADVVFAIGNPHGLANTVTKGIVSGLNKSGIGINEYENFIQTDAPINPGNSGGALVDSRGALVGINSAIFSKSGGSNGLGFAISSNLAKRIAKTLIEKGAVKRGFLGVSVADLTPKMAKFYNNKKGALIVDLNPNSDTYKKGLRRGDLVVAINNKKIDNATDLKNIIGSFEPNESIKIEYIRDNEINNISVKLSSYPDGDDSGNISNMIDGLYYKDLDRQSRKALRIDPSANGVVVTKVDRGSKADKAGFKKGDVIVQVERYSVEDSDSLDKILKKYKNRDKRVYVYRNGDIGMLIVR